MLVPMHEHLRDRVLTAWAALVSRCPWAVLWIAVAAVGMAATVSTVGVHVGPWRVGPLGFQADRNDLLSANLDWNRRFIDWQRGFGGRDQVVVIIDLGIRMGEPGYTARRAAGEALADELGVWLRTAEPRGTNGQRRPVAEAVFWALDPATADPRAIRLLKDEDFEAAIGRVSRGLEQARPVLSAQSAVAFLGQLQTAMATTPASTGSAASATFAALAERMFELARLIEAIGRLPGDLTADPFATLASGQGPDSPKRVYLASDNGRLLFLRFRPVLDTSRLNASAWALGQLHEKIAMLSIEHPGIEVGVTGIMALEAEETAAATRDSAIASVIAVVLIVAILVAAFHSWRTPLLAVVALLAGVTWTFGFATVVVGHLQVVSVVFTVILLGLGIAYGIHLAARFELVRHAYPDTDDGFEAAMRDSLRTVGPGVVTGALTTAAAFATTLLTDFKGVAEMGLIAAGGVMLCLVSMGTVFPAMLRLVKPGVRHVRAMDRRLLHLFEERWVMPAVRWPRVALVVASVLTVLAVVPIGAGRMPFDDDLIALLPAKAEAVRWQKRIALDGGEPIHFGISVCSSLQQARERAHRLRECDTVRSVTGVGLLLPDDDAARRATLDRLRQRLDELITVDGVPMAEPIGIITALTEMQGQLAVARGTRLLPEPLIAPARQLDAALRAAAEHWLSLDETQLAAAETHLNACFTAFRGQTVATFRQVTDTGPLDVQVLPAALRSTYVAPDGRCVLEIAPALPPGVDSPLDAGFLSRFVADMKRVDPLVTGPAVQIYESGLLIKRSYKIAGLLALGAVLVLVFLDFGRLHDALLSLLPVGVGFALTFGLMWLCGMRVNAANIIVLPLMFGIGVDAGVHMLHRYRADPTAQPLGLSHGTGKGITVTSLTAVIGFGSLLVASHRGIASLGFVMASGILLTMFACWWVLPAWLTLRRPRV